MAAFYDISAAPLPVRIINRWADARLPGGRGGGALQRRNARHTLHA
jgi:hypothetical protein